MEAKPLIIPLTGRNRSNIEMCLTPPFPNGIKGQD